MTEGNNIPVGVAGSIRRGAACPPRQSPPSSSPAVHPARPVGWSTTIATGDYRKIPMKEHEIALFNDSLERCAQTDFLDRFYTLFLASSPEVQQKFATTDMKRLKKALRSSFYVMVLAAQGNAEVNGQLEQIARVHSRHGRDIKPGLYELWLDCLVEAVRQCDPIFDTETEQAWRSMMRIGIRVMKERY